jgi:hypothetical protein
MLSNFYVASDMVSTRLVSLVNLLLEIVLLDLFYSEKVISNKCDDSFLLLLSDSLTKLAAFFPTKGEFTSLHIAWAFRIM